MSKPGGITTVEEAAHHALWLLTDSHLALGQQRVDDGVGKKEGGGKLVALSLVFIITTIIIIATRLSSGKCR